MSVYSLWLLLFWFVDSTQECKYFYVFGRVVGQRIMWVDASVLVGCMGCVVSGCATSQQRTWPLGLVTLASEAARGAVRTCAVEVLQ